MTFSPLVSAFFFSAGLLLMQAVYAAILARPGLIPAQRPYAKSMRLYGLLCLLAGLFQVALGFQYGTFVLSSAIIAHKWANVFMVGILLCGVFLIDVAVGPWPHRRFRMVWLACAVALFLWIENFTSSYGFRFTNVDLARVVTFSWGESILILSGPSSPMKLVLGAFVVGVSLYSLRLVVYQYRQSDWLTMGMVALLLAGVLISVRVTFLIDDGLVDLPYMGGFAMVGGSLAFLILFGRDIGKTLASEFSLRSRLTEEIEQLRHSDQVTQLPNLAAVLSLLDPLVGQHRRDGMAMAVFMFDIERIDAFNGTHGPGVADAVLLAVTDRLKGRVRANDLVARGAGNSFVVVMSGLKRHAQSPLHHQLHAVNLHQKIDSLFDEPFCVHHKELRLRCLTGLAIFPDDGATAEALLASAELALHEAKLKGDGNLQTFHSGLREHLREQLELETELRAALNRQEFHLHYQPQISVGDGRTVGVEALIRWSHPVLGNIPPGKFIPVAESAGLITQIGAWVLETACRQLAQWRVEGHLNLRMAVNLSAHQLVQSDLKDVVARLLQRFQLPPAALELEVTESALIQDPDKVTANMEALRKLGVRLMLDDFGTGYSSLNYLRILPVNGFKLDRSFIQNITRSPRDLAICSTAIQLAQALDLEVVAEGVETREQAEILASESCTYFQGYWFSKPLSAEDASEFFQSQNGKPLFSFKNHFETTDGWLRSAWRMSGSTSE
jgi:diguanylate cyclase (GGDEF)-like protein